MDEDKTTKTGQFVLMSDMISESKAYMCILCFKSHPLKEHYERMCLYIYLYDVTFRPSYVCNNLIFWMQID